MPAIPAGGITTQHQVTIAIQATSYSQVAPVAGHVAEVIIDVLRLVRSAGIGNGGVGIAAVLAAARLEDNRILHHGVSVGRHFIMVVLVVHHELGTRALDGFKTTVGARLVPIIIPGAIHIERNGTRAGGIGAGEIQRTILHLNTAGEVIGRVENQHRIAGLGDAGSGEVTVLIHVVDDAGIGRILMPGEGIAILQLGIALAHEAGIIVGAHINLAGCHLAVNVHLAVLLIRAVHVRITEGDGIAVHIHARRHRSICALFMPAGMRSGTICAPHIAHGNTLVILALVGVACVLTAPDVAFGPNQNTGIGLQADIKEHRSVAVLVFSKIGITCGIRHKYLFIRKIRSIGHTLEQSHGAVLLQALHIGQGQGIAQIERHAGAQRKERRGLAVGAVAGKVQIRHGVPCHRTGRGDIEGCSRCIYHGDGGGTHIQISAQLPVCPAIQHGRTQRHIAAGHQLGTGAEGQRLDAGFLAGERHRGRGITQRHHTKRGIGGRRHLGPIGQRNRFNISHTTHLHGGAIQRGGTKCQRAAGVQRGAGAHVQGVHDRVPHQLQRTALHSHRIEMRGAGKALLIAAHLGQAEATLSHVNHICIHRRRGGGKLHTQALLVAICIRGGLHA